MGRIMSDAEIRRRKKLQGHISQTTSTLGLTGLGVTGAAALAARKPGALRAVQKIPKMKNATPASMKNAAINTGLVSGGIGGVGGFNFASYTGAESRKRKPVVKSMDMGWYGDEGVPVELEAIPVEIEKAWEPVAQNFDSEANRHKRAKKYQEGAAAGSVGLAGGSLYQTGKALSQRGAALNYRPKNAPHGPLTRGQAAHVKGKIKPLNRAAMKSYKTAGVLAGASVAAAGASQALKRKRKSDSWASYAKRDTTSAFGVDHMNGQHRETGN